MRVFNFAKWIAIVGTGLLLSPTNVGAADLPPTVGPLYSIVPPPVPPGQWCRSLPIQMVTVKSTRQVQEWCDPKSNDLLHADVFAKLANGKPGANLGANIDYPCAGDSSLGLPAPPSDVRSALCAH